MFCFQSYYYVERRGGTPFGKLYNKYRNWKRNVTSKTDITVESSSKKARVDQFAVGDNEDEHVRILKTKFETLTSEERMLHWTACAASRMNSIKNIEFSSTQITDIWPQYKTPDGFRLVRRTCLNSMKDNSF